MIFFFFTFPPTHFFFSFSLENLKKFQQRVIQHSSFSGLTFSDWLRGSSRFIWKTLTFFRGALFPNGVVRFFSVCGRKVKSKVRSVLVLFGRSTGVYLGKPRQIEMSHYAPGEFRQRVSTCQLQRQMMSSSEAVRGMSQSAGHIICVVCMHAL